MPTMGGEFDHGLRADGEVAITGELGHQRYALHLDFEQGGVAEIILAGNLSQRCRGSVTGRRRDLDVLRTNRHVIDAPALRPFGTAVANKPKGDSICPPFTTLPLTKFISPTNCATKTLAGLA